MKDMRMSLLCVVCCLMLLTGCCQHTWVEADCITPKACGKCGQVEGTAPGHTPGEVWESTDIVNARTISEQYCDTCGAKLSQGETPISSFCKDRDTFLFTPNQYLERLMSLAQEDYPNISYVIEDDGTVTIDRGIDDGRIVQCVFYRMYSTQMTKAEYDTAESYCIAVVACGTVEDVGQAFDTELIYAIACAADPSFTEDSLDELLKMKYTALRNAYEYKQEWGYWTNNEMLYQFGHGAVGVPDSDAGMGFDEILIYAVDELDFY